VLKHNIKAIPGKEVTPGEHPREWVMRYCYCSMAVTCVLVILAEALSII
jgi:hypothetical protein